MIAVIIVIIIITIIIVIDVAYGAGCVVSGRRVEGWSSGFVAVSVVQALGSWVHEFEEVRRLNLWPGSQINPTST